MITSTEFGEVETEATGVTTDVELAEVDTEATGVATVTAGALTVVTTDAAGTTAGAVTGAVGAAVLPFVAASCFSNAAAFAAS